MLLCRMEPCHLVNLLTRQLSLKNIQTMKYSYYQNKKQPPCAEVTDEEVANLIRHDEKLAHMTLDIRQHITANDIATADSIKGELPSVTFSARFTGGRRYDKLSEYNGEIVLDLDKKSPEELARISKAVTGNPHTHISFTSPKGNGYKLTTITCLPDGTLPQSPEEVRNYHAHAYDQVASLYEELCQTDIDESGKDMTRICYLPHDENVYLNPNPQVLIVDLNRPLREKKKKTPGRKKSSGTTTEKPPYQKPSDNISYPQSESRSLLALLLYYHDHKNKYEEGNRNNYLFRLTCTYNAYGIPKEEVAPFLRLNFTDIPPEEIDSLTDSAYQHTDEFNTRKLRTSQWNFLRIGQYINSHYETRYNQMKHRMECRKKGEEDFVMLDDMVSNSIWMELNEAGYPCSVKNMENLIYSDFSFSYHPIREYMNHLPQWDGIDHIGRLAESVHTIPAQREFWLKGFRHFLVGMVAAATQEEVVNHLCLLLCSKQNLGKTTFINKILSNDLRTDYLSTGIISAGNKDDLSRMAEFMLINFDEFEGMTGHELSLLKDLITRKFTSIRLPYARHTLNLPHWASFAGTCNYPQVLYDPTGNRRFLCYEIEKIDRYEIDYPQLYAQIKHLLDTGYRYWFEADENDEIERNNKPFIFQTPEEEMLLTHFRKPERFESFKYMTVSEIAEEIRNRTGYQYNHAGKILLGKILTKYGFQYVTSKNMRRYEVILLEAESVRNNQLYQ